MPTHGLAGKVSPSARIDDTHDPELRSWVESANDPKTDFPIQNLPLCAVAVETMHEADEHHDRAHMHEESHLGVAIGDQILDVTMLAEAGQFDTEDDDGEFGDALTLPYWLAACEDPEFRVEVRRRVQQFLRADAHAGQSTRRLRQKALIPQLGAKFMPPMPCFNYTDFYASKHHARNVGSMFRPDNPLLPNYAHVPIGYHGRASSIVVSPGDVRRPRGQTKADDAAMPTFGPCKMLDYELELAVVVGATSQLGEPVTMKDVAPHIAGMCILNDWSARDMQKWEYQPLGPFLAKNFATSVSPYIVTMEALQPFRVPGPEREADDPQPLDYLRSTDDWGFDITCEVYLQSQQMRDKKLDPAMLSRGSFKHMYWTIAQMLVHHTSNGCNISPGDLIGSGTISGPEKSSRGCLLELTWDGNTADGKPKPRTPITLPTGETRTFLADHDEVIMRAYCERPGFRRIGFGECRGRILPALV